MAESQHEEQPTAASILTEQVLIRISKEEYDAWTTAAEQNGVHVNILVRRVMAIALRMEATVARIEKLVVEAKRRRAEHMRSFKRKPGSAKRAEALDRAS